MAWIEDRIDRRRWLRGAAAVGLSLAAQRAVGLAKTPRQTTGPFYPYDRALESDADLVRVGGRSTLAKGVIAHLGGVVKDHRGRPVSGALVEIWQCDANGRYHHPRDRAQRTAGRELPGLRSLPHRRGWWLPLPDHRTGCIPGPYTAHPLRDPGSRLRAADHPDVREGCTRKRSGLDLQQHPGIRFAARVWWCPSSRIPTCPDSVSRASTTSSDSRVPCRAPPPTFARGGKFRPDVVPGDGPRPNRPRQRGRRVWTHPLDEPTPWHRWKSGLSQASMIMVVPPYSGITNFTPRIFISWHIRK